jgi:ribose transport system permease protein
MPASATILAATAVLFLISWIVQPQSLSAGSVSAMLPFAAVLAIVAAGQTLVIQQGGIDLSIPGIVSLTVVIMTHYPNGDDGKVLTAVGIAYGVALLAGVLAGFLVSIIGITAIVATLGTNALLFGANNEYGGGASRTTTNALSSFADGKVIGIPTSVIFAVVIVGLTGLIVKRTVLGRRFEAVGTSVRAARAAGIEPRRYQFGAYVAANLLYCTAGILLAGIVTTPNSFQGDAYLLPSVAAVVLGGTSLLGGKGSVVATGVAALFLSQLNQLILTTGVSAATTYLVQAAALAAGVVLYSFGWSGLRAWAQRAFRRPTGGYASP